MSLDFQKNVYHPRKKDTRCRFVTDLFIYSLDVVFLLYIQFFHFRTTYTWMTRWNDFVPHDPINLYDEARKGRYRNLGARYRINYDDSNFSQSFTYDRDQNETHQRPVTEFKYSKKSNRATHPLGDPVVVCKYYR